MGVNFERVAKPTGKKVRERVACRMRLIIIMGKEEARESPMVLRPAVN